jgi:hypothetical protein
MSGRIIDNCTLNWDTETDFKLWDDSYCCYVMKFNKYAKIIDGEVVINSEVSEMIDEKYKNDNNLNYIMVINERYAWVEFPNVENFFDKINFLLELEKGGVDSMLAGGDQIYSIGEYLIKEIVE